LARFRIFTWGIIPAPPPGKRAEIDPKDCQNQPKTTEQTRPNKYIIYKVSAKRSAFEQSGHAPKGYCFDGEDSKNYKIFICFSAKKEGSGQKSQDFDKKLCYYLIFSYLCALTAYK